MADFEISPIAESWYIANLKTYDFGGLSDVPGLQGLGKLPPVDNKGNVSWVNALDYATADSLFSSNNLRNALSSNPPSVASQGHQHTHEGLYSASLNGENIPDAIDWHTHSDLVLKSQINDIVSLTIDSIDIEAFITKNGGNFISKTNRIISETVLDSTYSVVYCNTDSAPFSVFLPIGVDGANYKIINCGSSGNDLTVISNGVEQIFGDSSSFVMVDGEIIDINYNSTEGWW